MQNVENKVVIITGASSGIGEETAKTLAKNGAKVVLSARREDRLQKLVSEIGSEKAAYLKSDVSDPDDMNAIVALAREKFGRVDVLFANAGIMPGGNMSELKVRDWMGMVDINIKGVLYSMAAVLPEFNAQKSGHIIVTSSVAGTKSVPGNAVYSGTKHFVRALIDSFRTESVMEGTNIRQGRGRTDVSQLHAPRIPPVTFRSRRSWTARAPRDRPRRSPPSFCSASRNRRSYSPVRGNISQTAHGTAAIP